MGWVDLLALGPTFMRYSGGASVPDSNPATFMVDGAYYYLSISLFDLFGDSPDVVPSKMRMAGRVTASPGATGTAYFGNGYLTDDYIVYAPLDANGEAQFSSGELDVGEAPYKYGSLVVGMESISPFQEVTFEITQFDAYFDVDDDDEEPAGECFWTDLVNATQECGASPDPEPPEVIDATGELDPEFAVVAFFNNTVDLIKQLSNGNIVVLGRFTSGMSTSSRGHLLLDPYADVALGGALNMGANTPSAAAILDAGDIYYIAGQWGGFDQNYLRARNSATGASVSSGFSLPTLQNIPSSAVFWPSDGRIAIAGTFTHINSVPMSRLGVINPDGSLYDGFSNPAIGGSLDFRILLAALTDGSLIVTTPGGVRRYLPDGTQDASFSLGYDGISTSMAETPDGGFVAFAYNSDTWPTIFVAKMDATGAPWPGFTPFAIATGTASLGQLCVYPDGRILAAAGSVYRILPDGSLDPEWVVPTLGGARGVSLQADGKVLVCGSFSSVNGQARSCIARLM